MPRGWTGKSEHLVASTINFLPEQRFAWRGEGKLRVLLTKKANHEHDSKADDYEISGEIPQAMADAPGEDSAEKAQSFIGGGLIIEGDIASEGDLQVEGSVRGGVKCRSLVVGQQGQISGKIEALDVVVSGRVLGPIRGNFVMLKPDSYVEGDIQYETLVVQMGALFSGSMQHVEDLNAVAAAAGETVEKSTPAIDLTRVAVPQSQPPPSPNSTLNGT